MTCGSRTDRQASARVRGASRTWLAMVSAALLTGCGDSSAPLADIYANYEPTGSWASPAIELVAAQDELNVAMPVAEPALTNEAQQPRVAAMMPMEDFLPEESNTAEDSAEAADEAEEKYWSFEEGGPSLQAPTPLRLPEVEEEAAVSSELPIAMLMPPQLMPTQEIEEVVPPQLMAPQEIEEQKIAEVAQEELEPAEIVSDEQAIVVESPQIALPVVESPVTAQESLPALAELTEQEKLLQALTRDSSSATTGVLTDARVDELAKSKIQSAYTMANRGAFYSAQQELIEVLRMISQAKDAQQGTPGRSKALAAGLRALRESEDFAPQGTELEAELETAVLCASHRTPIAKLPGSENVLPRLMMDRYLRYAQVQLSMSVAGEPAGSMALHALGKIHSQLGHAEPAKHRLADRHAIAFQQAALLAHNQNYLAAHELAVLLAKTGHFAESERLLIQVASRSPNAVVHRNLARVQQRLGRGAQVSTNLEYAQRLAQQGVSGTNTVQWVSPQDFADVNVRTPQFRTAQTPVQVTNSQVTHPQVTNSIPIPGQRPIAGRRRPQTTPQWR